MNSRETKKFSIKARAKSFLYAFKGLRIFITSQHNAWIHSIITVLVIIAGVWLKLSIAEWLFIIFAIGLVISAELFNTALEYIVDLISPEYNKKAGQIKDLIAAAVLICAITAAIIGLLIFIPRLMSAI